MANNATLSTAEEAWVEVLEQMEDELARLRRCALDSEELFELPTSWSPPENVGPLPEALAPRAQAVFTEMQELSVVLKDRRDETARQLRAIDSVPRSGSPTAVYIDLLG
ncbi:hypothetical protein ACFY5D_05885 [Paeniglutamicibacter sp. NPDC012692]|uniref:hypothetical protein n=1 Tax=Paeniglutamicibacter sp. NPDC012692 TaxID=3364388 RepID=UPI00369C00EA